jgi:hypothetical protein
MVVDVTDDDLETLLEPHVETGLHLWWKPHCREAATRTDDMGSHCSVFVRIDVRLCRPSGPVVLLREGRLAKLREELVETIKWNRLRSRDLDAQRFA